MKADRGKLPVLILAYNRPDFVTQLMEKVGEYEPERLYVACDGPKKSQAKDEHLVSEVQSALVNPSWVTSLSTRFGKENRGPRVAVGSAIDWFFENERSGIILEDDCIPSRDFFRFAEHILAKYGNDRNIWGATGSNTAGIRFKNGASYGFSRIPLTWGWATWANRWNQNDSELRTYPAHREKVGFGGWPSRAHLLAFQRHLDSILAHSEPDAWDYPWAWSVMSQGGMWIVPEAHLVDNVGFREDSTNTKTERLRGGPIEELGKIRDPESVGINPKVEKMILSRIHNLMWPLWLNLPINFLRRQKKRAQKVLRFQR